MLAKFGPVNVVGGSVPYFWLRLRQSPETLQLVQNLGYTLVQWRLSIVGDVLVLNATYEPLSIVSVKRAVVLLLKEKAELVEATEAKLRSENYSLPRPLVIRLVYFVKIPHRISLPVTRRGVLARDHYTCQYCGVMPLRKDLTMDHVLPRSRGGKTTWENVVTACDKCNGRKGSRTPTEANMTLLNPPRRPRYIAIAALGSVETKEAWGKYMWE